MTTNTKAVNQIAIIRAVIEQIILHPDDLKISTTALTRSVSVQIKAHRGDTGRILGTKGATFEAIRKIATAMGDKAELRILIPPISEPTVGVKDQYPPIKSQNEWPKGKILGLIEDICEQCFEGNLTTNIVDGEGKNSSVEVVCHEAQKPETITAIREALAVLMEAFGNSVGRKFTFDLVVEPTKAQPATAAGRFSRET